MLQRIKNIPIKKWAYASLLVFIVLSLLGVIIFRYLPVWITPYMVVRSVEQLNDQERDFRFEKDWVSLENISPYMVKAVITSEDQLFMEHNGFDFVAIEKAMNHNKANKKKLGASTISQQTAKNVFLWHGRNWIRKGMEAYFTILVETLWSKERILEVYLNVIEYGDGIYGIEAASKHFFNKSATQLNKDEAAVLAAILPAPLKFNPVKPSPYVQKRKNRIKRQMNNVALPQEVQTYLTAR